jgi:hypothetical protein
VLLTCWLKNANIFAMGEFAKKYLQHIVKDETKLFNIVNLSHVTMTQRVEDTGILVVTYLINSETKLKNLEAFVCHRMTVMTQTIVSLLIAI